MYCSVCLWGFMHDKQCISIHIWIKTEMREQRCQKIFHWGAWDSVQRALHWCCVARVTWMESVYIIQSCNTQMCISSRKVHVSPFTHQSLCYHPHKDSPTHLGVEQGPSRLQIYYSVWEMLVERLPAS